MRRLVSPALLLAAALCVAGAVAPASAADEPAFCGDVAAFCTHHCGEDPGDCPETCRTTNIARIEKAAADPAVGLTEAGIVKGCNAFCVDDPTPGKCLAACAADLGALARCPEEDDGWWSIARYFVFPILGLVGAFLFLATRKGSMGRSVDI